MHRRLIDSSATKVRRYSWFIFLELLAVLLALFMSVFSTTELRAHAASESMLKNMRVSHYLDSHRFAPLSTAKFSDGSQVKSKPPALMLTRTSSLGIISHGKQSIDYVLSVSNGRSVGPVAAGNTLIISNVIPTGVTDITAHARSSAWKVKLASKIGPSILTATYIGAYPVLAGASLAPILVHGVLEHAKNQPLFLPAIVRLLHSDNAKKGSATLLQQQSAHDFTVQRVAPTAVTPLGENPTYQVGQTVTYTLAINNSSTAGALLTGDSVTVTDSIPAGLTGLTVSASSSDWTLSLGATTSPTTLTATYIGTYPVLPGAAFSPIIVVGTLTTPAIPQVANTAVVVTPNDSNVANNSSTNTIMVVAQPDLTLTKTVPTGTTFQVGKPVTYTFTANNASGAGPILMGDSIIITDPIPAGLTGLTASANSDWTLSLGATTSPTTLTATYTGNYPVASGAPLSSITLTGTPTTTALDVSSTHVGYWPFDENSGTLSYDSTANHTTGTINGATWTSGEFNSALSFNGTSNYVNMGTPSVLEFNNTSFTVVSWFKSTSTTSSRMVSTGLSTWNSGFYLGLNNSSCTTGCVSGDLGANGTVGNTVAFNTTTTFNDNQWHQAVMVIDQTAKTAQIYVDGVAQPLSKSFCGTVSGTTINFSTCSLVNTYSTTEPFTVGAYKGTGGEYQFFSGSLDEVRAYSSALSSTQVQSLYPNPQLINTATVTTPNDSNNANNSATRAIVVYPQPDLSLTKSVALYSTPLVRGQAQGQRFHSALKTRLLRRS